MSQKEGCNLLRESKGEEAKLTRKEGRWMGGGYYKQWGERNKQLSVGGARKQKKSDDNMIRARKNNNKQWGHIGSEKCPRRHVAGHC